MNNDEPQFITDGKEFFVAFESSLVSGYMPVPIPKAEPFMHWNGPKIDLVKSWYPALSFMRKYVEHEVVLRLFMTRDKSEIIIFPLTQIYGTGMSVKEDITKEERESWAASGLIESGTMHSHCNSAAFASATDTHDEDRRDGLHITIGKLKSDQYDIHARMVWTIPGEEKDGKLIRASITTTQKPVLSEWFIMPGHVLTFIDKEPELHDSVIKYMVTKPFKASYPPEWDAKLIRRAPIVSSSAWEGYGHGQLFDPASGKYVERKRQLSMADDIPDQPAKKKDPEKNDQNSNADIMKHNLLFELWNEAFTIIADYPALCEAQVKVSDFDPILRPRLFQLIPVAEQAWAHIERVLMANHVSQDEFFDNWMHMPT